MDANTKEQYNIIFSNLSLQEKRNKTVQEVLTKDEYVFYNSALNEINALIIKTIHKKSREGRLTFNEYFDYLKLYLIYIGDNEDKVEIDFMEKVLYLTNKITDSNNEKYNFEVIACILYETYY